MPLLADLAANDRLHALGRLPGIWRQLSSQQAGKADQAEGAAAHPRVIGIAMGRRCEVTEMASTIHGLLSDQTSYATGAVMDMMDVTGG